MLLKDLIARILVNNAPLKTAEVRFFYAMRQGGLLIFLCLFLLSGCGRIFTTAEEDKKSRETGEIPYDKVNTMNFLYMQEVHMALWKQVQELKQEIKILKEKRCVCLPK